MYNGVEKNHFVKVLHGEDNESWRKTMLSVNNVLYEPNNIYNFINTSVNLMINNIPGLTARKEYWLFYFIKDDFRANVSSLYNVDVDTDFLGFPVIKKNTRHAVESFLDLYNLCSDQDYMDVLKYCSYESKCAGKYSSYLHNGQFTIISKNKIAKEKYDGDFQFLVDIAQQSNAYIHPNVFVDVIPVNERNKKENILKKLLNTNIFLLDQAYKLLLKQCNQNMQPYIGCLGCTNGQCFQCYQKAYYNLWNCIDTRLLIESHQEAIYYNNQ